MRERGKGEKRERKKRGKGGRKLRGREERVKGKEVGRIGGSKDERREE